MRTVWKFPLEVTDRQTIPMPEGAVIRHVAQDWMDDISAWVEVESDSSMPTVDVNIVITGTGHPIPEDGEFVGTVLAAPFVWHVWRMP